MFGEVASRLLKLMGHRSSILSVLLAEDVRVALDRLEATLKADKRLLEKQESTVKKGDDPEVTLSQRALPMVELLNATARAECNVMWDSRFNFSPLTTGRRHRHKRGEFYDERCR